MSARQLFRQEAIDFQRGQREFGEITLLQPVSTKLLAWLLTAVVAIAIVFLCFAQFSRKQTVAGFLIPAAGTMKVFPTREGVVSDLHVEEGQHVEAGDPLFTVATPEVAADGEDVNAAKLASMRHQKEMLEQPDRGRTADRRGRARAPEGACRQQRSRNRRYTQTDRDPDRAHPDRREPRRDRTGASDERLYVGGGGKAPGRCAAGAEAKSGGAAPAIGREAEQARGNKAYAGGAADRDRAQNPAAARRDRHDRAAARRGEGTKLVCRPGAGGRTDRHAAGP